MKKSKEDLLKAMSDINDKYIQEILDEDMGIADPKVAYITKKRRMRKTVWSVVAVAAACLLGFVMINVLETGVKTSYESTSDSAAPAAQEETAQMADDTMNATESGDEENEVMDTSPAVTGNKDIDSKGIQTGGADSADESADIMEEAALNTEDQEQSSDDAAASEALESSESDIYEGEIPELGLSLTLAYPSHTGAELTWKQKGGDVTGSLEFSKEYKIEVFDGTNWTSVETAEGAAFEDIAMSITKDGTTEYELDWSSIYGELPTGTYRVVMTVNDFRSAGDYDTYTITAEFDL